MPGLMPGIHVLTIFKDVDGRDKPGHDAERMIGLSLVMPGTRVRPKAGPSTCFMAGIHVLTIFKDVDGRDKPGHDAECCDAECYDAVSGTGPAAATLIASTRATWAASRSLPS